ncbi:MAG: hypothetical protein Q8K91_06585 [Hylemonella sp.]|nr:hypothetical protein [Hylemonella sp.]MDP1936855.1 hypothetical protein [Hylemonella sp.]
MKKQVVLTAAMLASGLCLAQDVGRVISITPIVQQMAVPRQVCTTEQVAVQAPKSGAGALMGAIAGGAIGNSVGSGAGQAAATMIGLVGGAALGDKIEGTPTPQLQNVQRCGVQTVYENRGTVYHVVYEYAGKQYTAQLPYDPGRTMAVQITPAGANPATAPVSNAIAQPPVYVQQQPAPVVVTPAAYPVYYPQPYYPPIGIQLGFGYWGGYRGHRHWH